MSRGGGEAQVPGRGAPSGGTTTISLAATREAQRAVREGARFPGGARDAVTTGGTFVLGVDAPTSEEKSKGGNVKGVVKASGSVGGENASGGGMSINTALKVGHKDKFGQGGATEINNISNGSKTSRDVTAKCIDTRVAAGRCGGWGGGGEGGGDQEEEEPRSPETPGRTKDLRGFWSTQNDEVKVVKKKRFVADDTQNSVPIMDGGIGGPNSSTGPALPIGSRLSGGVSMSAGAGSTVVENTPKKTAEGVIRSDDPSEWQKPLEVEDGHAKNLASAFQQKQQLQQPGVQQQQQQQQLLQRPKKWAGPQPVVNREEGRASNGDVTESLPKATVRDLSERLVRQVGQPDGQKGGGGGTGPPGSDRASFSGATVIVLAENEPAQAPADVVKSEVQAKDEPVFESGRTKNLLAHWKNTEVEYNAPKTSTSRLTGGSKPAWIAEIEEAKGITVDIPLPTVTGDKLPGEGVAEQGDSKLGMGESLAVRESSLSQSSTTTGDSSNRFEQKQENWNTSEMTARRWGGDDVGRGGSGSGKEGGGELRRSEINFDEYLISGVGGGGAGGGGSSQSSTSAAYRFEASRNEEEEKHLITSRASAEEGLVTSSGLAADERLVTSSRLAADERLMTSSRLAADERLVTSSRLATDERYMTSSMTASSEAQSLESNARLYEQGSSNMLTTTTSLMTTSNQQPHQHQVTEKSVARSSGAARQELDTAEDMLRDILKELQHDAEDLSRQSYSSNRQTTTQSYNSQIHDHAYVQSKSNVNYATSTSTSASAANETSLNFPQDSRWFSEEPGASVYLNMATPANTQDDSFSSYSYENAPVIAPVPTPRTTTTTAHNNQMATLDATQPQQRDSFISSSSSLSSPPSSCRPYSHYEDAHEALPEQGGRGGAGGGGEEEVKKRDRSPGVAGGKHEKGSKSNEKGSKENRKSGTGKSEEDEKAEFSSFKPHILCANKIVTLHNADTARCLTRASGNLVSSGGQKTVKCKTS